MLIVNIVGSGVFELVATNKFGNTETFIASLNYKPSPDRIQQFTNIETEDDAIQKSIIYPNPIKGGQSLYVKIPKQTQEGFAKMRIVNGIGRLVKETGYDLSTGVEIINCGTLNMPEGIYFVRVFIKNEEYFHRVIVIKQ